MERKETNKSKNEHELALKTAGAQAGRVSEKKTVVFVFCVTLSIFLVLILPRLFFSFKIVRFLFFFGRCT